MSPAGGAGRPSAPSSGTRHTSGPSGQDRLLPAPRTRSTSSKHTPAPSSAPGPALFLLLIKLLHLLSLITVLLNPELTSNGRLPVSHLCLEGTATLATASSRLLLLDTDLQDVFLSTVRMHLTLAQEAAPQMAQHWPVAVSRKVSQALQCRGKLISWVERPVYSHLQVQEVQVQQI